MRNKYFVLRHGKVQKAGEIIYDWPSLFSYPMTEKGKKQIVSVAKKLKNKKIDLIYSSDSLRTHQTAEIVAKELGVKVNFDPRLRDVNLGVYQGRKKEKFFRDFPDNLERFSRLIPEGENWSEVQKRIKKTIKEIDERHKGKIILIISHGDPLWLLEGMIKGWSDEELLEKRKTGNLIKMGELRELKV